MHRGKVDPGVSELPRGNELSRDHVNRPLVANPKSFTDAVAAAKREEYNDQIVSGSAPWSKQQAQQESMMHRPVSQVSVNALSPPGVAPAQPGVEGDLLRQ